MSRRPGSGARRTNFVNNVINGAQWRPVTLTNALTEQTFTGYNWANRSTTNENFFIRNTEGFQYIGHERQRDRHRRSAAQLQGADAAARQLAQATASAIRCRTCSPRPKGTWTTRASATGWAGRTWDSPNTALINTFGELTNSRRHEFKVYVAYKIPKIDVMLGGVLHRATADGRTRRSSAVLERPAEPADQRAEADLPRAARHREERLLQQRRSSGREGVQGSDATASVCLPTSSNLFNTATVTTRQARYPSTTISGATVLYKAPTGLQGARQITFGGRWSF